MKTYVAGKDLERARRVMEQLKNAGHYITYDWVTRINDRSNMTQKAIDERQAIIDCDALVYLWEEDQESARYEAGMAMGLNKKVVVSGKDNAHFFTLPNIVVANSDDDVVDALIEAQ